jgi:hypothetical protein
MRPPLTLRQDLVLIHVDARFLLHGLLAGNAIEVLVVDVRKTEVAVCADDRAAHRATLALNEGVLLRAEWRVIVVGVALEGVGIHHDAVAAGGNLETAVAVLVYGGHAALDLAPEAAGRHEIGNAIVGGVDDTADRLAAVAQRRRPAHDLHLLG